VANVSNEAALHRVTGFILPEQNDEPAVQRGHYIALDYIALSTMACLGDDPVV
jgi:hypothetical protein